MKRLFINKLLPAWSLLAVLLFSMGCDDQADDTLEIKPEDRTMMQRLASQPADFSMFMEMVERSGLYGILNARGTFTGFIPKNSSVQEYMKANNISSIASMEEAKLKRLVATHFLVSSERTTAMLPGVFKDTTFAGSLLTVKFGDGGLKNVVINDKVKIITRDLECSNGFVQVVDQMITPLSSMTADIVAELNGTTIFAEALQETKIAEVLNKSRDAKGKKALYTVLVEPDEVFKAKGINSFADLKALYSSGPSDVSNPENGLYKFMAYHCLVKRVYSSDMDPQMYVTLDGRLLSIVDEDGELRINPEYDQYGEYTGATKFFRNAETKELVMDIQAVNGVIHQITKMLVPRDPRPIDVKMDVLDVPEYRKLYDNPHYDTDQITMYTKDVARWEGTGDKTHVFVNLGWRGCTNLGSANLMGYTGSFTFITLPVPKGTYRVDIAYKANSETAFGSYNVTVDDFDQTLFFDEREGGGDPTKSVGTFTFTKNGAHIVKFTSVRPGRLTPTCITLSPVFN